MSGKRRRALGWVRVGVTMVLAIASISGVISLAYALDFYDDKADHFASLDNRDRSYGNWHGVPVVIREPDVVERALKVMPPEASYRVVTGASWVPSYTSRVSNTVEADFLRFYLLPRRQSNNGNVRWAFCLGCDLGALGSSVRVVAGDTGGMRFVRIMR